MTEEQFDVFSVETGIEHGKDYLGEVWSKAVETVLSVALNNPDRLPTLSFIVRPIPFREYIEKWVTSYQKGHQNRPSRING